jgi:hypothetical protein
VALLAVINERRFEAGLDAGDDAFVDVAFALLPCCRFDVEVDELLSVDDRDAQLFLLSTIATRSSSCCVALNNMRFTCFSPARAGETANGWVSSLEYPVTGSGKPLRALLVVSLLPVSEINQRFRPGCGRTGGGLQVLALLALPVPRNSKRPEDHTENE